jgi:cytochrome bd ubiquinol oxidase subunit I
LRTADAVAPVAAGTVGASLLAFMALYAVLLLAFLWYGAHLVIQGPEALAATPEPIRPGIDHAGPALVAGAAAPQAAE